MTTRTRHIRNEAKSILVQWLQRHPGRFFTTRQLAYWTQLSYGYCRARCPTFARYKVPLLKEVVIRPGGKGRPVLAYCLAGTWEHHAKHFRHYAVIGAGEYLAELGRQRAAAALQEHPGPGVGVPIEQPKLPVARNPLTPRERMQKLLQEYRRVMGQYPTAAVQQRRLQIEEEAKRLGYVFNVTRRRA